MYSLLKNQKKGITLQHNGYYFTKYYTGGRKTTRRCIKRGCGGRLKAPNVLDAVSDIEGVELLGCHNHPAMPNFAVRQEKREDIALGSIETQRPARQIINYAVRGVNQGGISAVGSYSSLVQKINRDRKLSVDPETITEPVLNIDESLMRTLSYHRFYQFRPTFLRGMVEASNIVIFFDESQIVQFRASKVWSIDGTFDVCPRGWMQLYTISIIRNRHVLPIVYALLPSKATSCHKEFIFYINRLISGLTPNIIITDFELAAINAFQASYPSARLSGCMFHLGQSI